MASSHGVTTTTLPCVPTLSATDVAHHLGRIEEQGYTIILIGHDGDSLGGNVASLWTFPAHGIVVAITSNISYADTPGLAVKIAEVFAEVLKS